MVAVKKRTAEDRSRRRDLGSLPATDANLEAYSRHVFLSATEKEWHPRFCGPLLMDRACSGEMKAGAEGWVAPVLARPTEPSRTPGWDRLIAIDNDRETLGRALNELQACGRKLQDLVRELADRWSDPDPDPRGDPDDPDPVVTISADNMVRLDFVRVMRVLDALRKAGVLTPRAFWLPRRRLALPAAIIANTEGRGFSPHELAAMAILCGERPPTMTRRWTVKKAVAMMADVMRKARSRKARKSDA